MDAVSSALRSAAGLGMDVTDPQLLRSTNNTVIWLPPSPVVAKVAPATSSTLDWELVVASALVGTEARVVGRRIGSRQWWIAMRLGHDLLPELDANDRKLLTEVLCRSGEIADLSARRCALHGSPQGFNILMVEDKPAFIDFETVCYGPVEWDLGHLDPAAARRYPADYDLEALRLARLVVSAMTSALCWEGIDRGVDMRFHAEHHLAVVRGALGGSA